MQQIILPPPADGGPAPELPPFGQLTLIGANGSGKTRFMHSLVEGCGDSAYVLSALDAFYPDCGAAPRPGSIDALYREATARHPYLRGEAVSEFDKLMFLLVADECAYLLDRKSRRLFGDNPGPERPTRLDRLITLWQRLFPGNEVLRQGAGLMFTTPAGDDAVPALKLSKGERAALYYIAATLYAPPRAVVFIDSPSLFLHPALVNSFWNSLERLRPDCRFVYNTYDLGFVGTRTEGVCIWIRSYDAATGTYDYGLMEPGTLSDDLTLQLIGARRPVLFIEGDATHSLDARLYTLVFADHTVRPLGGCDRVIEATRAFGGLQALHRLDSHGIVDRDRRTPHEVEYLRRKNIMVPEVAEIENLFLLESVIRIMAQQRGRNPDKVFAKVRNHVLRLWETQMEQQALMHVRHRLKRLAECRIDGRFHTIGELRDHIRRLPEILDPDGTYRTLRADFAKMARGGDYAGVLRVFNHKPMLALSGVGPLLGLRSAEAYVDAVIATLKHEGPGAVSLRDAFRKALGAPLQNP